MVLMLQIIFNWLTRFAWLAAILVIPMELRASEVSPMAIIVHEDVDKTTISMTELQLVFWRKREYWANGLKMRPVNLNPNHPLRLQFSTVVLNSLPSAQIDYWNGLYFTGVSPPHVVNSSEAALRYVQKTKGAIAYVDACALLEKNRHNEVTNAVNNVMANIKILAWINSVGELVNVQPSNSCNE